MSKESTKKKLTGDGFHHIYEWQDKPRTKYPPHAHKGKVAMYILEGGLTLTIEGKTTELKKGDRFDVPVGARHFAEVGPNGCSCIVGDEKPHYKARPCKKVPICSEPYAKKADVKSALTKKSPLCSIKLDCCRGD